jgi:hypothetical protein
LHSSGFPRLAYLLLPVLTGSCVIPIPAEVETGDGGGLNAPPIIQTSIPEMPGPITLPQTLSVTFKDIDVGDTLFVRVFRDYTADQRPVLDLRIPNDPLNGTELRTQLIDALAICNGAPTDEDIVVDIMVADREYDMENVTLPPAYRRVTGNGESSIRSWIARCSP